MIKISCGLCCSKNTPCESCMKSTLLANGLEGSEENLSRIRGLVGVNPYNCWSVSELGYELKKLIEKEGAKDE